MLLGTLPRTVNNLNHHSFTHGVLNTDNMSILGDTIDYGPYGFLERFNPDFTPNTTDLQGRRYAFRNQPSVCQWNCAQLANALLAADLLPLVRLPALLFACVVRVCCSRVLFACVVCVCCPHNNVTQSNFTY